MKDRVAETEDETALPAAGSLSKYLKQLEMRWSEARTQELFLAFQFGFRSPRTWDFLQCPFRPLAESWIGNELSGLTPAPVWNAGTAGNDVASYAMVPAAENKFQNIKIEEKNPEVFVLHCLDEK